MTGFGRNFAFLAVEERARAIVTGGKIACAGSMTMLLLTRKRQVRQRILPIAPARHMMSRMKIASFNINGIKARIAALSDWLAAAAPDLAVLQEIKSVDENFPAAHFEDMGYNVATHGQKGFNGVAILSKLPLEDVTRGLPGDDADEQARYVEATVVGDRAVQVAGLYLPNGNPAPGPKYDYKLDWMERLRLRAAELLATEMPVVMLGDFNIIPQPAMLPSRVSGSRTRCSCPKAAPRFATEAYRIGEGLGPVAGLSVD